MAQQAPKPCRAAGCGFLVRDGSGFCDKHADRRVRWQPDRERGSRHERGLGTDYDKLRPQVIRRDKGLCQSCVRADRTTPFTQVDHIVSRAECKRLNRSPNTLDNLECICNACHEEKSAREAAQGRRRGSA